ncbi:hypothetical protein DUZ99_00900 [Xylanibacillus composti]|nr:hypothetical protein [Xylanibacillus composti]
MIGFFTVSALIILWLGVHKLRHGEERSGYLLIALSAVMLLSSHFSLILAIILISLGFFYIRSRQIQPSEFYVQKQNILQSLKWNKDPWILRSMSVWSVIGEIHIDLSLALLEENEAVMVMQGVIGDIDIIVPEDLGVIVQSTVVFGQTNIGDEREAGLMNKIYWKSPQYEQCEYKVKFVLSYIVGDVDVKVM